jgi:hypothetical protein
MKGTFEAEDFNVLGMAEDEAKSNKMVADAKFNKMVSDAQKGDVNASSQMKSKALSNVAKNLAMVVHKDVPKTHEKINATIMAIMLNTRHDKGKEVLGYYGVPTHIGGRRKSTNKLTFKPNLTEAPYLLDLASKPPKAKVIQGPFMFLGGTSKEKGGCVVFSHPPNDFVS